MNSYQYRTELPDSTGIWKVRHADGTEETFEVKANHLANHVKGSCGAVYCKLMDLPTIAEPVKYREPTMADVGKMVEMRDDDNQLWMQRKLIWIKSNPSIKFPFVTIDDSEKTNTYRQARIVDDGSEQGLREYWVHVSHVGPDRLEAYHCPQSHIEPGWSEIKVREVREC